MKRTLEGTSSSRATTETQPAVAFLSGATAIIQLLLQNGANQYINTRNPEGDTPLMIAAHTGTVADIQLLLAHGANINMEDKKLGAQPLWLAVDGQNSSEAVEELLKARPYNIDHIPSAKPHDPYWNNHDPYCALSGAALEGDDELVTLLIKHGASIDTHEPHYKTPLKRAIQDLDLTMVHHLLEQGKQQVDANRDIITRMILYVREQFSCNPPLSPAASQTLTLILHKLYTV